MRTFASIHNRSTWITGRPHGPWGGADASSPSAKLLSFGFDITADGAGYYVLVYYSMDRVYGGDTWHETISDAYSTAEEAFGIRHEEWGPAQDD
jgi:hypothetical protein